MRVMRYYGMKCARSKKCHEDDRNCFLCCDHLQWDGTRYFCDVGKGLYVE